MSDYISKQTNERKQWMYVVESLYRLIQRREITDFDLLQADQVYGVAQKIVMFSPSDQEKAARLRGAIEEAMAIEWELSGEPTPVYVILQQALSGGTEPVGAQKVKELLSKHQGMNLHDVTMRNVLKEIAPLFGINTGEGKV